MINTSNTTKKWEQLPQEILEMIGKHLDSCIEVFRFRATSTSWRSAVPFSHLQSQHLSLNLPHPFKSTITLTPFTLCRLEDETKSSACLVKVIESKSSGKLELINPLISQKRKQQTPTALSTAAAASGNNHDDHSITDNNTTENNNNNNNNNDRVINLLDFRLIKLIEGYSFKFRRLSPIDDIKKAITCHENSGMLALFESGKLWYWCNGDEKWSHLGNEGSSYDDIIVYKGQYYVIDSLGIVSWIDNKFKSLIQYAPPLCGFGQLKNLVVSDDVFYVVDSYLEDDGVVTGNPFDRCRFRKVKIKVYKLDEEWGTWVDVETIGNKVFVLGKEVCFAVDVKDYPGCLGDCIYFVDPRMEDRFIRGRPKRLVGRVFRFDNGSIRTVDCFPGYKRLFCPSMNWSSIILRVIPRSHDNELTI